MEANSEKETAAQIGKKDFSVFELLKVPIFVTDEGGKLVYGNQVFAELVGVKKERLSGTPVLSLIQSEVSGMQRVFDTGDDAPVDTWATIKGKKHFFEYMPAPVYDAKGVIRGVVETVIDRTGQKLALQAVGDVVAKAKAGELSTRADIKAEGDYRIIIDGINEMLDLVVDRVRWYEAMLDAIPFPISVTDNEMNWTFINKPVEEFLNLKRKDVIGKQCSNWNANICKTDNCGVTCLRNNKYKTYFDQFGCNFQVDCAYLTDGKGVKIGHIEVVQDISAIVKSKNYMDVELDRLAKNLEQLSIGLTDLDTDVAEGDQYTLIEKGHCEKINKYLLKVKDAINALVNDALLLSKAAVDGRLATRADDTKHQGEYRKIVQGINATMYAVIGPLNVAADYVDKIGRGNIPAKITDNYNGDFNTIKNSLNNCIDEIGGVTGEMASLVGAVSKGILTQRGAAEGFHGVYRELIQGMNRLVDSIADPLDDLTTCLGRMAVNDLTKKMEKDYPGIWGELKDTTNNVHDHLVHIRETVANISNGDLSDLEEFKNTGKRSGNDTLTPAFIKLLESIKGVIDEVAMLTGSVTAGDLSRRADESAFQGAYRDIVHGLGGLVEFVAGSLNELMAMLDRLAVKDYTQKIVVNYTGVWDKLKVAANTTMERSLHIQETVVKISNGDLSDLERFKKVDRRSNNDQLTPAMTRMMEAIKGLIGDTEMLAEAAVEGKLSARADAAKHQGEYRKVVEGINNILDAILKPIGEAADCLQEMSRGNLDTEIKGDYKGDYAVIKESLNATLEAMNEILGQVAIAVNQVTTGARQVSDSSQSLSQAATESASSLEEISASMHEMTSQVSMNAENAIQANQLAAQAKSSAEKGNGEMGAMVKAMNDINESASSISKIIKAIDEIAFQTNLLALNAAVEAARAGKHGKGFTVVAEEVRNLAQRSATAAKETAEMIEGSIKKTEAGAKIAVETSKALEEIVTGVTKVTDLIGEIASASKEQAEGIAQINQGLSQVDQVTQQVTANSEESASASEELSSQSLQLKQMLGKFRLRKKGFNPASGLPDGITPEMLQMLRSMLQSQQMAAASDMQSGFSGGRSTKKKGAGFSPSDVIALDDDEFGNF
jgi:methyl-accepting chemotaxis protein